MHILLIHQAFAALDEAGGTRHYEMARYLVKRGHSVTIITSPVSYLTGKPRDNVNTAQKLEHPEPGITILRTYTYSALHRSFFHRMFSFFSFMVSSFTAGLRVQKVDLVWGTSPPIFQGVTAWLLARLKGVPFLFEVRDLWPAFAIAVGVLHNKTLIQLSLWLERFLYRHSDRVVVNSPGYIQHVVDHGAKWVELVPNGADPSMFLPESRGEAFRSKHGLDGAFVALYAGAHGLSNDLGIILEAASSSRERKDIRFVLVGDGKEKPALLQQAKELQLDNVLFVPSVPKNEISEILAAANACIAILKPLEMYKTTYPNKVFDYMAAGRPVILVIDGVIREVIEKASCGIPVPPGNAQELARAAISLADNPKMAEEMGTAGRHSVETEFLREKYANQFALMLEEMI